MRFNSTATRLALSISALGLLATSASAQTLKATKLYTGFASPLYVCSPPGDTSRLFVVEQNGRIRIVQNGVLLTTDFMNIGPSGTNNKISTGSERGLLGMAFHPNYASNGFFYVDYTNISGDTMVVRFTVSAGNPNVASVASATTMIGPIAQPQSNHNGGGLNFGADGMLYIAMGDGGNFDDTGSGHAAGGNAQSGSTLLGKLLRLDVDIASPYIPASNPFFGAGAPLDEIWHMGLRNPFRFSFDRQTGDLYIGDVGQDAVEEVDFAANGVGGLNFGWRCMEGNSCTGLSGCTCNDVALTDPIKDYSQISPGHLAVIGGYVYRGCAIPGLQGTYFYADEDSTLWSFRYTVAGGVTNFTDRTSELEPAGVDTIGTISSFGEDALGEIYICDYSDGEIYRIEAAGSSYADCNNNTINDACDIALGTSQDINTNGVPDECECVGFPPPFVYCTAKLNSQLCLPAIGYTGLPKMSSGTPFVITAAQIVNNKQGLLFYGYGANAAPFQGGTMCVQQPVKRTPVQNSGGSGAGSNCTGSFAFNMTAYINSGIDPALVVGQQVNCEYWSRDPQDPFTTNVTNAVQFVICN